MDDNFKKPTGAECDSIFKAVHSSKDEGTVQEGPLPSTVMVSDKTLNLNQIIQHYLETLLVLRICKAPQGIVALQKMFKEVMPFEVPIVEATSTFPMKHSTDGSISHLQLIVLCPRNLPYRETMVYHMSMDGKSIDINGCTPELRKSLLVEVKRVADTACGMDLKPGEKKKASAILLPSNRLVKPNGEFH